MILLSGGMSLAMMKILGVSFIASIIVFIFSVRYFYKQKYAPIRAIFSKTQRFITIIMFLIFAGFISFVSFFMFIILFGFIFAK